jgi:hypothetical protein
MIQWKNQPADKIHTRGVLYCGATSEVLSDPHDPPWTVPGDRAINSRASSPNVPQVVISVVIDGPIGKWDGDSIVFVLVGHLAERRDEEAFDLWGMHCDTAPGQEIRDPRFAAINSVGGFRVRNDSAKTEPSNRINLQVGAGTLRGSGSAEKEAGSQDGDSSLGGRRGLLRQDRLAGQCQKQKKQYE